MLGDDPRVARRRKPASVRSPRARAEDTSESPKVPPGTQEAKLDQAPRWWRGKQVCRAGGRGSSQCF